MLTHGLTVSRETSERLSLYVEELIRWQKRFNLIGPATEQEIWDRHIADSWQIAELLNTGDNVVDLGSGAGLPGLIMAIRFADLGGGNVTMVETNGKKCAFLQHMRRALDLPSHTTIDVQNDRVETVIPKIEAKATISARAFTALENLLDHTSRSQHASAFRHLFPKGRRVEEELSVARQHYAFRLKTYQSRLAADSVILEITDLQSI